jgi:hypothetical protein
MEGGGRVGTPSCESPTCAHSERHPELPEDSPRVAGYPPRGYDGRMRSLLPALVALGCSGAPFTAGTEPSLLGEAGAAAEAAGAAGDGLGGADGGPGTGGKAPSLTAGAMSLGGGGKGGTGGLNATSGAGGAVAGQSGGGTGGEPLPERCVPPSGVVGVACGAACDLPPGKLPAGYEWSSAPCDCSSSTPVGGVSRVDLLGDALECTGTELDDGAMRLKYTLNHDECVRIDAPWPGWTLRVFKTGASVGTRVENCALVRGGDPDGTLPSTRVEVFGDGDAWVRVDVVECNFGSGVSACPN